MARPPIAVAPSSGAERGGAPSGVVIMRWLLGVLLIMLVVLQVRLWTGEGSVAQYHHLSERIQEQQQTNEFLLQRNEELAVEVEALRHSDDAIEERARADLGMIRDGEIFYMIVDEKQGGDERR